MSDERVKRVGQKLVRLDELENWLAPSEAGRLIGTSGQWITNLCRRGELRCVRTALGWLIEPTHLEHFRSVRQMQLEEKLRKMGEHSVESVIGPRRGKQ